MNKQQLEYALTLMPDDAHDIRILGDGTLAPGVRGPGALSFASQQATSLDLFRVIPPLMHSPDYRFKLRPNETLNAIPGHKRKAYPWPKQPLEEYLRSPEFAEKLELHNAQQKLGDAICRKDHDTE
jgi:hypothetical protein